MLLVNAVANMAFVVSHKTTAQRGVNPILEFAPEIRHPVLRAVLLSVHLFLFLLAKTQAVELIKPAKAPHLETVAQATDGVDPQPITAQ